jgi:hypothetical protein
VLLVNRTVVDGARLQKGQWVRWKPPCDDAGTPAELAASTATDLVAFCTDGRADLGPGRNPLSGRGEARVPPRTRASRFGKSSSGNGLSRFARLGPE